MGRTAGGTSFIRVEAAISMVKTRIQRPTHRPYGWPAVGSARGVGLAVRTGRDAELAPEGLGDRDLRVVARQAGDLADAGLGTAKVFRGACHAIAREVAHRRLTGRGAE